jgi:IstB-like ATP binding protein
VASVRSVWAVACIEDINYKAARGLDKQQIATLATGEWLRRSQNLLIAAGSDIRDWLPSAARFQGEK